MRGVIEAPVVAYHTPFLTGLTAQDAADEQAYRARLDEQADAAAAEIAAFLTAQEQEEDAAHDEPVTGIGEEWR